MAKLLFRETILPWYYAKSVQIVILLLSLFFIWFGAQGIRIAWEYEPLSRYLWPPILVLTAAVFMAILSAIRLKRAFSHKPSRFLD